MLEVGDPAPWFQQRTASNPDYRFASAAGRYLVLCFFGSASAPHSVFARNLLDEHRQLFDDEKIAFFGISNDPADEQGGRLVQQLPGIRYFWDFDFKIAKLFGVLPQIDTAPDPALVSPCCFVLDPTLRVMARFPLAADGTDSEAVASSLRALPPLDAHAGFPVQAPVIILPNVFEPELCRHLIALYEAAGGEASGFMQERDGKTVLVSDPRHKKRSDFLIKDQVLIQTLQQRFTRRILPEIAKVHHFAATRMERYLVGCYAAEDGGHFRAHRDNTTRGTAHRRFAVSINLNAEFEGGEVSFPEYGPRSFKPPPGGAVVFSCSLLHAVSEVTQGRRYAFLPFLYDDAAAKIRQANQAYLEGGSYRDAQEP